ncbi:MAG: iron ABC transporter permease [Pseudomonadota bacterium]
MGAVILAGLLLLPVAAVVYAASGSSGDLWAHLATTKLPLYVGNTLALMVGVGVVAAVFGVSSAWIVYRYDFFGREVLQWILLLPAAVPAYIVAYTLTDFLEYAGPVQGLVRDVGGFSSAREYWFPEIRSLGGAVLVMGAVLYPYVYVMARTAFSQTPSSLYEVAIISDRSVFRTVALPMARPAIVGGLTLVLMETVSDFGTVEYFAVETLTLGIFNVWIGMHSLAAAAQIALVGFVFILVLLTIEQRARAERRFTDPASRALPLPRQKLSPLGTLGAIVACLLPIGIGFILPVSVLVGFILEGSSLAPNATMLAAAQNSIMLAGGMAILVVAMSAYLGIVATYRGGRRLRLLTQIASVGYAFPGAILAIGAVTVGGAFDALSVRVLSGGLGIETGGWLSGSIGLVMIACAVRFKAIGYGAVGAGLARVPENMMHASRTLGRGFAESTRRVVVPLLWRALLAGALLVFVDVMKELPMTLLLRPFGFETLPTFVYQYAKDELLEEAALPALAILVTGIIPVVLMNATLERLNRR